MWVLSREYPKWQAKCDLSPTDVVALLKGEPSIIRFAPTDTSSVGFAATFSRWRRLILHFAFYGRVIVSLRFANYKTLSLLLFSSFVL